MLAAGWLVPFLALSIPQSSETEQVSVRGRFLHPDGAPAADVRIRMHGWRANSDRVLRHGVPETWKDIEAATDVEGRFRLSFVAPPAYQFILEAELEGHAKEKWALARPRAWPGGRPGGRRSTTRGRSRGPRPRRGGSTARGNLEASGDHGGSQPYPADVYAARREETREGYYARGNADGRFRIGGLPEGTCQLELFLEGGVRVLGPVVEVVPGESAEMDVVYAGPDVGARIHTVISPRRVKGAYPRLESITLERPGMEPLRPTPSESATSGFDFDGLAPDSYALVVDDPSFEPVRLEGIRPGEGRVRVLLEGRGAIHLDVRDATTGRPLERYSVGLHMENESFPPIESPHFKVRGGGEWVHVGRNASSVLLTEDRNPPEGGRFTGIPPARYTLVVGGCGRASVFLPLEVDANQVPSLQVDLVKGGRIDGQVTDAPTLAPIARATVELFRPGDELEDPRGSYTLSGPRHPWSLGQGRAVAKDETDADGRYGLVHVAPGVYTLRLRTPDGREVLLEGLVVQDETGQTHDVPVPPGPDMRRLLLEEAMADPAE